MKPLCIYHGNCADGFGSAWVVRKFYGADGVDFHAGIYGNPPPDVTGRDVILVDFSYKRPVLADMAKVANSIKILDHHKTAEEDLYRLWEDPEFDGTAVEVFFDMSRSGAGLTWDHYFPTEPRPLLINHLEDRDLWRFALEGTREIQASVFSYPYDFEVWDKLMAMDTAALRAEGVAIERKHHKDVAELVSVTKRMMKIGGYVVPVANVPYTLASDAGHLMAVDAPFAACYWDTPEGRVFSLRSREDGADVSEIAKLYGGGGHKHASGFRVGYDRLPEFIA